MFEYRCSEVAKRTGGTLSGPDATVSGVSCDSRLVRRGDLFFALAGERVDGHEYVDQAFTAGAAAAVVSRPPASIGLPGRESDLSLIRVADPLASLGALAAHHRARFRPRVVGVTGSLGKTTTKDLIAAVLSQRFETLKSEGNLNTEIGVPLTLFRLGSEHQAAVIEMAMRGRGQIRQLARMAEPEVGVITNIGLSHLELLGSQDAIAEAKAELLEALPPTGAAILNADDPYSEFLAGRALRSIRCGFGPEADVRCEGMERARKETGWGVTFRWSAPAFGVESDAAAIPLPGRHNVANALTAIAAGLWLGMAADEIAAGLERAEIAAMRMEILPGRDGSLILNDAYNASSPAAMLAALEVLAERGAGRRRVAVLGSMLELGPASEAAHREVGEAAARPEGPDVLVTVGEAARGIALGAVRHGMPADRVLACPDNSSAVDALSRAIRPGDVVLVKGSRGVALEAVVRRLVDDERAACPC